MAKERPVYQSISPVEVAEAEAALERDAPDELLHVVIGVGLYEDNLPWAEAFCLRLANHSHFNVRGNALLSLGYLARRFKTLNRSESLVAVQTGLSDSHKYVRGQADDAADYIETFLKVKVRH